MSLNLPDLDQPITEKQGLLLVVATPLGNHGDLSIRAQEALALAEVILAEDTRRTGLLLSAFNIKAKQLYSFHDHNEEEKIGQVINLISQGHTVALVSDAGTPLMADPGFRLVRAVRNAGLKVSPVPGPSAPITALSASGIAPLPFAFLGFPPRKAGDKVKFFSPYKNISMTLVFFERKDRVYSTLDDVFSVLGDRECCIARELTKTYEEFVVFNLSEREKFIKELLGEITIIIGPPLEVLKSSISEVLEVINTSLAEQAYKPRQLVKVVQKKIFGWSADELYDFICSQKK